MEIPIYCLLSFVFGFLVSSVIDVFKTLSDKYKKEQTD